MCIEDFKLGYQMSVNRVWKNALSGAATLILPPNPQRIGLYLTGSEARALEYRIGTDVGQAVGHWRKHFEQNSPGELLSIKDYGRAIQDNVWCYTPSATTSIALIEYTLPTLGI